MDRLIIVLLVLSSFTPPGHAQHSSSREWGKPIVFSDFESAPDDADTAAANISVTIVLGYSIMWNGNLKFRAVAVMDKDKSWIKGAFKNEAVLKHEQGHFDIAQIYAKKLETTLKNRRYTRKDIGLLEAIYDQFLGMMNDLQIRYDQETGGGMNSTAQSLWRKFIQQELEGVSGV